MPRQVAAAAAVKAVQYGPHVQSSERSSLILIHDAVTHMDEPQLSIMDEPYSTPSATATALRQRPAREQIQLRATVFRVW